MVRTRVGYTGGTSPEPTYHNLGDHSEAIQIDYDPVRISYQQLLEIFWESHNQVWEPLSKQYASFVFYHDRAQKTEAVLSKQQAEARHGSRFFTEIRPFPTFFIAEDYHQKYFLQQEPDLFREFSTIYPLISRLIGSTAAARVNGYLGGHGTTAELEANLPNLGLSPGGIQRLLELRRRIPLRCT